MYYKNMLPSYRNQSIYCANQLIAFYTRATYFYKTLLQQLKLIKTYSESLSEISKTIKGKTNFLNKIKDTRELSSTENYFPQFSKVSLKCGHHGLCWPCTGLVLFQNHLALLHLFYGCEKLTQLPGIKILCTKRHVLQQH